MPAGRKVREAPASFGDHFSQPRLFWLSMSPLEREHIVAAYSFELSKCEEKSVRERVLSTLARIDDELCAAVAAGLGLPVPAATEPPADVSPSRQLSQIGGTWPLDGRTVGIVTDPDGDPTGAGEVRQAVLDAGMVPLVIAPVGGELTTDGDPVTVQRTFAAARSVEFDALLFAGVPAVAADAYGARDATAGGPRSAAPADPRVLALLGEAYRHGKAIGGWHGANRLFEAAGIPDDAPGIVTAADGPTALRHLAALLSTHRVWSRFPTPAS